MSNQEERMHHEPRELLPFSFTESESIGLTAAPLANAIVEQMREQLAARTSPFLDVPEAAEYLRCKPQRIYDLVSQRVLPACRDGRRLLLRTSDLEAYVSETRSEKHRLRR
jgi:excisionase family DNA binding protein